jgi:hypothetical protein
MKQIRQSLLLAILLVFGAMSALAQSTATLSGTVSDPSGAVLPGAQVKVISLGTGLTREMVTDGAGVYSAPSLQPGDYTVQVTAPGFGQYTVQKVTLDVDARVSINAQLSVTAAGAVVDVQSGASQVETQSMTVGQVIDRETVQDIPLNGRHFLDLTVLTPGGVVAPTAGSLTATSRGLGANSFITAGNREDSVNFQVNGINLNDMSQNQITFQPSINTTSEFKIDNSTFSAEYGRSSGSIVNISTKSGTNKFHGEAFDYFRNEALDARNYFNRSFSAPTGLPLAGSTGDKAPLKRNNFGGAVGGPIWKDKTFFFASYEGLRQHQGLLQNGTVFSPQQRLNITSVGSPAANALLALVPGGNSGNNYVAFTPGPVQIDQFTGDVLQVFNTKDQLHGFYAYQADKRTEPNLQGNTIPGFGDHRVGHRQILTLNETHVFSPSVVNEARLGFNRIAITFTPNALLNPANYHIADGVNAAIGIPQITVSDLNLNFGGPSGFAQGRVDNYVVASDTATVLKGKNTIKFGGEFRRFIGNSFASDTGTMTYATSQLTTDNFEQDVVTGFTINPQTVTSRIFINAQGYFIQDNYKLTPRLTLEGGFRFEWNGTPTEGANRLIIFDPAQPWLVQTRTNGYGGIFKQNYNFEPRGGFAYDVFGNAHTVLRGGYAYLSDQPVSGVATNLTTNPPLSNPVSYTTSKTIPTIPVSSLYTSAALAGIALSSTNLHFKNAYTESFNLNLSQQLPYGIVSSIGYYGSVGKHLRARTNQNEPLNGGARPFLALAANSPIDPSKGINLNIPEANNVGSSNYNAMWLTASKSFSTGLSFNMNYEWSKSLDTNSLGSQGGYTFQTSYNPGNNYGASDFDTRNHYAANAIYNLPFKKNRFVAGYQLSTIFQYQTGNPVNLTYNTSTYTGVAGVIRPNLVGPIATKKVQAGAITNVNFIQSTVCAIGPTLAVPAGCSFQNPAISVGGVTTFTGIGNMSRNMIYGPGFADLDVSGGKNTKITEGVSFNLRVDAFDILNHPNFAQPAGNTASLSNFGQISATRFAISDGGSSRQLQVSGKFVF